MAERNLMALPVYIQGHDHYRAKVTALGQLVVAPLEFSAGSTVTMSATNVGYEVWPAKIGKNFIITGIVPSSDRFVTAQSKIDIYESTVTAVTSVDKEIISLEVAKNNSVPLLPLNLKVTEGKYVNAKCDDVNVLLTIMGYYIDVT